MTATVLLTDHAWPDDAIERSVIEGAGFRLVSGPPVPGSAREIEALVAAERPVAVMTCWAEVSAGAIAASPGLKIVARLGVGLDNIAVAAATARGIWVTNVPDYCVEEVSDHAVGFMLAWARGIVHFDREVRAGRWEPASARLRRVANLTCGIVGFGRIGRMTARKLAAFGCRVLVHDPALDAGTAAVGVAGVEGVDATTLFSGSDVVIVHAPLLPDTRHLVGTAQLARMPAGGLLVNVSRGAVVDTDAVVRALQDGRLSAAALDVLESEPDVPPALLAQPGAMLTPHVAFSSDASVAELRRRAAEEVVRVLQGKAPLEARNRPATPASAGDEA